jgi:hypothetical protein
MMFTRTIVHCGQTSDLPFVATGNLATARCAISQLARINDSRIVGCISCHRYFSYKDKIPPKRLGKGCHITQSQAAYHYSNTANNEQCHAELAHQLLPKRITITSLESEVHPHSSYNELEQEETPLKRSKSYTSYDYVRRA